MIGSHIHFTKNLTTTLQNTRLNTVQFFMGSNFKLCIPTEKDIKNATFIAKSRNMDVFAHAPYNWNLAGSIKAKELGHIGKGVDIMIRERVKNIERELNVFDAFGKEGLNTGVVIHPGSYPCEQDCMNAIVKSLKQVKIPNNTYLLLENCAGQGTSQPRNLYQLQYILKHVNNPRLGVCLDTCHLFAVGDYNISRIDEIDRLKNDFDSIIGLDKLKLIHLNDSKTEIGKKVDRHAPAGFGHIWGNNPEALIYFLNSFKSIPKVTE